MTHYLIIILTLVGLQACSSSVEQAKPSSAPTHYQNPIIAGFHPDPSVTRVGEDYYLVNSSFEWFPGIPIYHSKDLVNWRPIGHALTRPSQLKMVKNGASSGVWAPTIRYHQGKYYVIVTCKQCGMNLYVTADKPEGPYSDPIIVDAPKGIDPSLFFDDDGKVWFSANRFPQKPAYKIQHIVYTQQIDLETGKLFGPRYDLTDGKDCGIRATEGPHHYKVGDKYFLVTAEGMTWEKHAVCIYSSDTPYGPFELLPGNPKLSHRDKPDSLFHHTGHADLIQTQKGDWYSVLLAVRKLTDKSYYLGRETVMVPVEWKEGLPYLGSKEGEILEFEPRPNLAWAPWPKQAPRDEFDSDQLGLQWNLLRTPLTQWWRLGDGKLELPLRKERATERANPSLVARRFQHFDFEAITKIAFEPQQDDEEAGLIAIQNDRFQYRLVISQEKGEPVLKLMKAYNKQRKVLKEVLVHQQPYNGETVLALEVHGLEMQFKVGEDEESLTNFAPVQDAKVMSSHVAGGFTGAYVGMYASANGKKSTNTASFDWFSYEALGSD